MKTAAIALLAVRRLARQRTALFFTVALPMVIILVVGLATQRFEDGDLPIGVVSHGSGAWGQELVGSIDDLGVVSVVPFDDVADLRRAVRRGTVEAGIVVPERYEEVLRSGGEADVVLLADVARGFPAPVATAVTAAVAERGASLQAARFVTREVGGDLDDNLRAVAQLAASAPTATVMPEPIGTGTRLSIGTGFEYQAPANLVLFVFITSLTASATLIETRRLGITRRMLATPTSAGTVLAGEALGRFLIALVQALIISLAGIAVFGVAWGDPIGAGALILTFVLVGTGVGMLFGTVFRTPEQAGALGAPVGIALGMLGGCMWPLEIVPEAMQRLGHVFPHAWAMDAWIDLTAYGRGLGDVLPELGVLAAFAVALLATSTWRLRRVILAG